MATRSDGQEAHLDVHAIRHLAVRRVVDAGCALGASDTRRTAEGDGRGVRAARAVWTKVQCMRWKEGEGSLQDFGSGIGPFVETADCAACHDLATRCKTGILRA